MKVKKLTLIALSLIVTSCCGLPTTGDVINDTINNYCYEGNVPYGESEMSLLFSSISDIIYNPYVDRYYVEYDHLDQLDYVNPYDSLPYIIVYIEEGVFSSFIEEYKRWLNYEINDISDVYYIQVINWDPKNIQPTFNILKH